jgi:hypothetical protein
MDGEIAEGGFVLTVVVESAEVETVLVEVD